MSNEFPAVVWISDGHIHRLTPVTVSYDLDGYKPIGLWIYDATGADRTLDIAEKEYDRLYEDACKKVADDMACAIDICFGERNG